MKSTFVSRPMMVVVTCILAALTGCATVSVDPARMGMLVTHSASPGMEGMSTTETLRCRFKNGPISPALAAKYKDNPSQAFADKVCEIDEGKVIVQGAPTVAGQMAVGAANAATGGLVSFAIQNRLQRQQQEFCKRTPGGCGQQTVFNNVNQNKADAAAVQEQTFQANTQVGGTPPACVAANNCGK